MQTWLAHPRAARLCALLGAFTIAWSSILVKLSHASPTTSAIYRCAYALPILLLLTVLEDRRLGPRKWSDRRPALVAGVFMAADLVLWHHSIEDVGAGLATVLANIQVVLIPLVAWLALSERPSARILASLPAALIGVVMISGVIGRGAYGVDPGAGAAYGVGAGVAYVGALLFLRRAGVDTRRLAGPLFDLTLSAAVGGCLIGLVVGDTSFVPRWPGAGWLILLAVGPQVVGWLLIAASLPRLPAALTSLLLMIQPICSMIFGAAIFGESPDAIQLGGVLVVLGAVIAAARGPAAVRAPAAGAPAGAPRRNAPARYELDLAGEVPIVSETDPARVP